MQRIYFVYDIGTWVLKCAFTIFLDAQKAKARILISMLMHFNTNIINKTYDLHKILDD